MKKDNAEKSQSVDGSRRKVLKTMAGAGAFAGLLAVSGKWSKPVVDSIILPAHAQATNAAAPGADNITTTTSTTTTVAPQGGSVSYGGAIFSSESIVVSPHEQAFAPSSHMKK